MRKTVRGALQGCTLRKGLAACPHQHQMLLCFFEGPSQEVWVVLSSGGRVQGKSRVPFRLSDLSYKSTDSTSSSHGLDVATYRHLNSIFTTFVSQSVPILTIFRHF